MMMIMMMIMMMMIMMMMHDEGVGGRLLPENVFYPLLRSWVDMHNVSFNDLIPQIQNIGQIKLESGFVHTSHVRELKTVPN